MSYVGLIGAFDILDAHACLWYGQKQTAGVYIAGVRMIGQIKAVIMTEKHKLSHSRTPASNVYSNPAPLVAQHLA